MSRKHNFRFYDHDDQGHGSSNHNNIRKVSFKNYHGRIQKSKRDKGRDKHIVNLKLNDDDIDMIGCDAQSAQAFRMNKGRNFKGRAKSPVLRPNTLKNCDWYRVKILFGAKYDKNVLLKLILAHISPQAFMPVSYTCVGSHSYFYVDNMKTALMLKNTNRKLQLPDGHMIGIIVVADSPPTVQINAELKEKMKLVMEKRYLETNKALNLSGFSKDAELSYGLYCPLSRPQVLRAALQIVCENIPDVFSIDLTGNKIQTFNEGPAAEFQKLKNLRILHLGENCIKNFSSLNALKGLELTELVLKGNPIIDIFSDRAHFVSEIRKRFPKLTKLDNAELPPIISFDVGDEAKLPQPQASFICSPEGRPIVREFLLQYFALFDSDKRAELIQGYHDNAYFSQCSYYCPNQNSHWNCRLGSYIPESRNLFKVPDHERRKNRLHIGKENVIKCLEQFPKTQHDLSSFVVDLTLFTPALITLSLSGVYREPSQSTSEASWPMRHFSRTFLIVPVGQGFCIVNDSLFITNPTDEERASAFKLETPNAAILQSPSTSAAAPVSFPGPSAPHDDAARLQMVQALATQSGMNLMWSKKCLDDTNWDLERALFTFWELQRQGMVPPDAFL